MRKLALILASVAALSAFAGANIKWKSERHDFGAFHESSGAATAIFTYYNTGDEPLVITGARANCGCTKPQYSTEILQPGDSATLTVTYDPGGRPGRFEKNVFVDSNAPQQRSTLTIRGIVVGSPSTLAGRYPIEVGELRMAHPAALLGTVDRKQVKVLFETIYNGSTSVMTPAITDVPEWLSVKVIPDSLQPGEQATMSMLVNGPSVPEWDLYVDTITVSPAKNSSVRYRMPVIVTVTEDFSKLPDSERSKAPVAVVTPTRLDPVVVGNAGAKATFTITNDGKRPLKLRRLYTRTPGVTTNVRRDREIKPGKSFTAIVDIKPAALEGAHAAAVTLTLVTNSPTNHKTTITIPITDSVAH